MKRDLRKEKMKFYTLGDLSFFKVSNFFLTTWSTFPSGYTGLPTHNETSATTVQIIFIYFAYMYSAHYSCIRFFSLPNHLIRLSINFNLHIKKFLVVIRISFFADNPVTKCASMKIIINVLILELRERANNYLYKNEKHIIWNNSGINMKNLRLSFYIE